MIQEFKRVNLAMGMVEEEAQAVAEREADFRLAVMARWGGKCACGEVEGLKVELIHPPYYGGKRVPENAALICRACLTRREEGVKDYCSSKWGAFHSRVSLELPRELHMRVKALAEDQGRTVTSVIRELLIGWVGVHDSRPAMDVLLGNIKIK